MTKRPEDLRSARWFAPDDLRSMGHRSRAMQMGLSDEDWDGKPVIAIINTWSDLSPCHHHLRDRAAFVKQGVYQAGGMPVEMPVHSFSEQFLKPTSMLYRNMGALEVEETLRSHPIDGAVLMGGCDKSTPALIMGAISAGLPFIFMPAGAMLRGNYAGEKLGSGTDVWKYWDERRAGTITKDQWDGVQGGIARSYGTCMTMGTASTMMSIAEGWGLTLPGASSIPAPDAGHKRMAAACGRRAVDMVWEDLTPDKIMTRESTMNAVTIAMATGCSTNAIIHLIAIARRAGLELGLDDFDRLSKEIPVLANIRPTGDTYLMEDFYYAGGLPALLKQIEGELDLSVMTVDGKTLGECIKDAEVYNDDVIRPLSNPVYHQGSLAVVRGNIAPDGAVMKPAAADARLHKHTGPAIVFDSYPEMKAAVDDENLDVTGDHIMVFRNAGPVGGPGMPEWGMLPIPTKLVKQGVRDMIRISDARMSGTSYGACILHVAPEAYIGGPLALVQNGDMIEVDIAARSMNLLVDEAELEKRKANWTPPKQETGRGYQWMSAQHIQQADTGCDFDFLETSFGKTAKEPDIF